MRGIMNKSTVKRVLKKSVAMLCVVTIVMASVIVYKRVDAAAAPTAQIVGFDGSTTNLRVSQLLSVKTSGFKPGSVTYNWYNGAHSVDRGGILDSLAAVLDFNYVYTSFNSAFGSIGIPLYHDKWSGESSAYKYFAVMDHRSRGGTVKCKVTGIDQNTGKEVTVEATYSGLKNSNLTADIVNHGYSLMTGTKLSGTELLQSNGVLHTVCKSSAITEFKRTSGSSVTINGTDITADKEGLSTIYVKMTKSENCSFHTGTSGSGTINIYVFEPIETESTSSTITVKKSNRSYKYTVNGVSQQGNGQDLVFEGLQQDTNYEVLREISVGGQTFANASSQKTLKLFAIAFQAVGVGQIVDKKGNPINEVLVDEGTSLDVGTNIQPKAAEGFKFRGWSSNEKGTSIILQNASGRLLTNIGATQVVYALFEEIKYTAQINVRKDGASYDVGAVSLYQDGKEKYKLTNDSTGVYKTAPNVVYRGDYQIYINGAYTGLDWEFYPSTSEENTAVVYPVNGIDKYVDYYTLKVNKYVEGIEDTNQTEYSLYFNNNPTDPTEENYKVADMTKGEDGYTVTLLEKVASGNRNQYLLYENNEATGYKVDISSQHEISVDYNEAAVRICKDDQNWTDAVVTLKGEEFGNIYKLTYDDGQEVYKTASPILVDTYVVQVGGIAGGSNTGVKLIPTPLAVSTVDDGEEPIDDCEELIDSTGFESVVDNKLDFYTRTFYSGESVMGRPFQPQIIQRNAIVSEPVSTPTKNGAAFKGWYVEDGKNGDDGLFSFETPVITGQSVYAGWQGASVVIGDYEKSEDGTSYTMPKLVITGYEVVGNVVVKITDGGKNVVVDEQSLTEIGATVQYTNKNTMALISFPDDYPDDDDRDGIEAEKVQEFLRHHVHVKPSGNAVNGVHSLEVQIYGSTAQ